MKEADLNSIIRNSFLSLNGFAFKIPDPQGAVATMSVQNPFDGFAVVPGSIVYWESKLLKGDYQAFPFSSIRDHQKVYLKKIKSLAQDNKWDMVETIVPVGIWSSRKFFDLIIFDISYILYREGLGDLSVKKKELLELKEKGFAFEIKNKLIDLSSYRERIVRHG